MMLESIFLFLAVFIAGFVFGWMNHAYSFFKRVTTDPDEMIQLLNSYKKVKGQAVPEVQSDSPSAREIKVEKHSGVLYLYAKDTDEFLAQGSTLQEALANVDKRFPGKTFRGHLSKEEADSLGIRAD